jgi:transketolase
MNIASPWEHSSMDKLGYACARRLTEIAESNSKVWVLDGDLATSNGAEIFASRHMNRFINIGIAEQVLVSAAAGMAACGLRPWVFSFGAFLSYRAYDQIRVCVVQTKLPVVLVGSHSGALVGRNGKTHTTLNDIALMATLPGLSVWTPADRHDAQFCVDQIHAAGTPAYLRLPRESVPAIAGTPASVRWLGEAHSIAIISAGLSSHWALGAAAMLRAKGVDVGVLHFCQIAPLDVELVRELLAGVDIAFAVEDHYAGGGVATLLRDLQLPLQITSIAWPSDWCGQSGEAGMLLTAHGLHTEGIAERLLEYMGVRRASMTEPHSADRRVLASGLPPLATRL